MTRFTAAALRGAAILIAILGAIDPAIRSERRPRPDVAVVADDPAFAELADRVADALHESFNILREPFGAAAATVLVGTDLPEAGIRGPVLAVVPEARTRVAIERVDAPRTASSDARTRIVARVRVTRADGRRVEIALKNGNLVIDHATHAVRGDNEVLDVPLTFVPTTAGGTVLRVSARIDGVDESANADVAVDVRDTRHAILFFDHRPSWQATFVRRAIADDPRFVITSRVTTSRGVSTDVGRPPSSLADAASLAAFDVIAIGAPDLLNDADVRALERFMRERGGTVVLLFDHAATGAYERLAATTGWTGPRNARVTIRMRDGTDSLVAGQVSWPVRLPPGASPIATAGDQPVVWQSPVGAGRLIVSGALDAWRFRDRSGFHPFWRTLFAEAAAGSPPAIDIAVPDAPLKPGATAEVVVTVRDAALANETGARSVHSSISVRFETTAGRTPVRMWPDGQAGRFRGVIRAPREPGLYRLAVTANGAAATASVPVIAEVARARPDRTRALAMWIESRGGRLFDSTQLDRLPDELARIIDVEPRTTTWHPMRSAWWIVPFVLLLGLEWWIFRSRLQRS